jgi:collagenase-like PrtC family protease
LVGELQALQDMGIRRFRLSPHNIDMVAVAETYRRVLDGRSAPAAAMQRLHRLAGAATFANGFFHGREGKALVSGP